MAIKGFSVNCDELRKKVRYIRASKLPAEKVIDAILKASVYYDATEAEQVMHQIKRYLGNDEKRIKRYSEALQMEVQVIAHSNGGFWQMNDLTRFAREFAIFDSSPYARLCWFGWSEDLYKNHNQWMERIFYEPNEMRLHNRIKKLLGDLLQSDFLSREYADSIGIPPEEIAEARDELKKRKYDELLEIDGADWKVALLTKYLGEPLESGKTAPPERVRWYMSEAKISNEGALAYYKYVTLVQQAYEELERLSSDSANENGAGHDSRSLEEKAVDEFIDMINRLADKCYADWNGKMCPQGGRKQDVTVVIKRDELKAFMKNERKDNFEELKAIFSSKGKAARKQCKYIGSLREKGYFGKLTKKELAQVAGPILKLTDSESYSYIKKNL